MLLYKKHALRLSSRYSPLKTRYQIYILIFKVVSVRFAALDDSGYVKLYFVFFLRNASLTGTKLRVFKGIARCLLHNPKFQ